MEWNVKIQQLRKQANLTQEELARALYVSRTAVSKWESGRGYPNMDSMKALSAFFGITMDELLSGDELLVIAQEDTRPKSYHLRELVFGLLDCCAAGFFFLPVFGNQTQNFVQAVSLPALSEISPYLKTAYFITLSGMVVLGIAILALQNSSWKFWQQNSRKLSLILHSIATLLFTISRQPYAAAILLILLIIKGIFLAKQP